MRHIFIGDVHGMLNELNTLLDTLNLQPDDHIVFVGDLLDKGPDSPGVVKRVRQLSTEHSHVTLVSGNHEDTHQRYRGHLQKNPKTANEMAQRKPELLDITSELSSDDIAFLNAAKWFHRVPKHNILVVHGGITKDMPSFPNTEAEVESWSSKERKRFKLILRTRHVHATKGSFVGLGDEKPNDPFWADVYDGRFGHVIFGHQPFLEGVKFFPHATGIDTGAVFGGTLTALVYESSNPQNPIVVNVPCPAFAEMHYD